MLNKMISEMAEQMAEQLMDKIHDQMMKDIEDACRGMQKRAMTGEIESQCTLVLKLDRISGLVSMEGHNISQAEVHRLLEKCLHRQHDELLDVAIKGGKL